MGTIISLDIAGMGLDWSKNSKGVDHGALFQEQDRKRVRSDQISYEYYDGKDEELAPNEMAFVRRLKDVLPRLALLGFTRERAVREYESLAEACLEEASSESDDGGAQPPAFVSFDEFRAFVAKHPVADLDDTFVKSLDREKIKRGQSAEIVALSLFNPGDPLLDQIQAGPMAIGQQYSDWVTALHLAAARSDAKDFVAVTSAMIDRPSHGIWSFQDVTNRAVVERLRRDPDAVRLVKDRLAGSPSASEVASLPRYLSAAGALDEEVHQRCATLLQQEAREPLPRAGYDAVDDSIQAVSRSLLEVVTPSFSP